MNDAWTYNRQPPRPTWGVHAPTLKAASKRHPITVAPLPTEVTLSLAPRSASAAEPLVTRGERVLTGQPVGRGADGRQVNATINGEVVAVGLFPMPGPVPRRARGILIRGDGQDSRWPGHAPLPDVLQLPPDLIRRKVAEAGILGLGGALFSTAVKLDPHRPIRALILNGAECEPWITCDEMLLRERATRVIEGARIMMRALDTQRCVVAVETDMPEARATTYDAIAAIADARIGLSVVTAKYPAGGERQLIELITGEEVPAGALPVDIGYICHNVATAAAVAQFFRDGQPLISRIVTVTGSGIARPGNFEARIGTPIRELIALAGGYQNSPRRLIMGGPMMGFALPDDDLPVTKGTNCIVAATAEDLAPAKPELPCIRCGECIQVCPARLLPQELLSAAQRRDAARLDELGLLDCIECGCCDYVCPSYIPLTARFAAAKELPVERRAAAARAQHARERFEAKQTRLTREAGERAKELEEQTAELRTAGPPARNVIEQLLRRAQRRRDGHTGSSGGG